ncbi:MAG: hypothetical protein IPI16_07620 [Comamonadaceae bacterium]|nr:hypothetical protein [Comamonadaceae bacterium]
MLGSAVSNTDILPMVAICRAGAAVPADPPDRWRQSAATGQGRARPRRHEPVNMSGPDARWEQGWKLTVH